MVGMFIGINEVLSDLDWLALSGVFGVFFGFFWLNKVKNNKTNWPIKAVAKHPAPWSAR